MNSNHTDDLAELHAEVAAVARELLADSAPRWATIARAGWPGLEVSAAFDGADAGFAEVAVILTEIGRAAASGPYPAVAALGVGALNHVVPTPDRDRLLRETAAGAVVPIVALAGEGMGEKRFRIENSPRGPLLRGAAEFVLDVPDAGRLLVPAVDPAGEVVLVDLDPRARGLLVTERPVLDATRSFGDIVAEDVSPESLWHFEDGYRCDAVGRLRDRAAVAVACDSLGLSRAMLDATVAHVAVREQFGRAIGSFQAVKHACADMLVQVTVAGKLVDAAVRAVTASGADASTSASMAKSYACATAVDIAGKAMQLHGGMGYTWESGIHVYLKRAALNRSLFGSPAQHRARLARRYSVQAPRRRGA
ncbi:acyl-CoA dehydrogenase family protein [Nocardia fluminea]|uniref:Alkylation response protein AidB-like acyl-CoA dehydrogenase n=1 Tax=Nocardia fluminea TaxID=134984 RepID=A0A2N3VKR4_9NOCA|nr:acyl-CoA dehydrogenase family protein [Nocardia fluminea]PKV82192.1 alkylation response protein AidB-like acyl-CoA dehydrogenase [Nocardia fluminea]